MTDTHIKINSVTPRVQYTGNGVTTVFPYEFAIFDESDMVVYLGDEVQESGYSVSGAGQTEGGNVTFDVAPEDGVKITLLRSIPIERITDFQEGGTFRPKNLNDEFDRQTAFLQQVQETLDRSVKVGPTSDINPEEVLTEVERVYGSIDNIDTVADDISNVDAVAGNATNINAVAGNATNINTVAGNTTNINTVATNISNVNSVGTNISNVNTCATNISSIVDASKTVFLDRNQTFTAANTFEQTIFSNTTGTYARPLEIKNDVQDNSNPDTDHTREITFVASTSNVNNYLGSVGNAKGTNGAQNTYLRASTSSGGTFRDASMGIAILTDGTSYGYAPTPTSATDNSTRIATTEWVNNAKEMITNWGMPNYTAGVLGTSGTAPKNGFVIAKNVGGSGSPDAILTITYNGTTLNYYRLVWFEGICLPIPKGASWSITSGDNPYAYFYPCLGG